MRLPWCRLLRCRPAVIFCHTLAQAAAAVWVPDDHASNCRFYHFCHCRRRQQLLQLQLTFMQIMQRKVHIADEKTSLQVIGCCCCCCCFFFTRRQGVWACVLCSVLQLHRRRQRRRSRAAARVQDVSHVGHHTSKPTVDEHHGDNDDNSIPGFMV